MTSRRSFLRNLIAAVVLSPVVAKLAEAMPSIAEKALPVEWVVNPAWEDAQYEASFEFHSGALPPGWQADPYPARYEFVDGAYRQIPSHCKRARVTG